jgi:drug/metabolite transporter (DMT)-like permease
VGAGEFSAVLPDGHALPRRGTAAGGLDALARRAWPTRSEWISATVLGALMLGGGLRATAVAEVSVSSGLVVAFIAIGPALQAATGVALRHATHTARGRRHRPGPAGRAGPGRGAELLGIARGAAGGAGGLGGLEAGQRVDRARAAQVLGGRALDLAPGAMGYASQMLVGGVLLMAWPRWLFGEQPQWPPSRWPLASWLYLVVAGSLIAFSAFMVLLQRTPTAVSSSYAYVNPVIGCCWA